MGMPCTAGLACTPEAPCCLQITAGLANGSIDLVVGTHALISDVVAFHSLGLAIVDEQHRSAVFFCTAYLQARQVLLRGMLLRFSRSVRSSLQHGMHGGC